MTPHQTFEPDAASARAVRRFVSATLSAAGVDSQDANVVVNELATNAILHGRTEFTVGIEVGDGLCRVEIADRNPRLPVVATATAEATSGHGLGLVQALCSRWGVQALADGKVVWCEVPVFKVH